MSNWQRITSVALKGIALAMGVAVVVMSTLKTLTPESGVSLLGLGMVCLGLAALQKEA